MELSEFPVYRRKLNIRRGEGVWLFSEDGERYLDLYAGHAVAAFGYGAPFVSETLALASKELVFQSNAVDLPARKTAVGALSEVVPGGPWSILMVNSGAEANENALRLAFHLTKRTAVVAVKGAFHGRTAAAAAVTDGSTGWNAFPNSPFEVRWVNPDDYEDLSKVIDQDVAAVIVEPVQGVGGAVDFDDVFLSAIQTQANAVGAVVIADEVQTGAGRCGSFCASPETPLRPDIVTLGKGVAAGFPAAAVLAKQEHVVDLKIGQFGTTFGGGPVASAMIAETVCRLSDTRLMENVRNLSLKIKQEAPGQLVQRVSGKGLLLGLHCRRPAQEVLAELLNRKIIAGDSKNPNVVRLLPPLILRAEHVDMLLAALREIGN